MVQQGPEERDTDGGRVFHQEGWSKEAAHPGDGGLVWPEREASGGSGGL